MKYISTRGNSPALEFEEVLLTGLAPDGGLYLPAEWPALSEAEIADLTGRSYAEVATRVLSPFVGRSLPPDELARLVGDSYAAFHHAAVTPLAQLDAHLWLLELFHGPTLSFKDVALQLVGRLFDFMLARRGEHMTVIGATSGDTGSAAIAALKSSAAVDVVILHPKGRISEVQRRQMTTVEEGNVHNIAIDGTFDDCQSLVKALFNDDAFRRNVRMGAVNSINWARVMAQSVYYVYASVALGAPQRRISFSVPTGNFGDVFAGHVARRMGLPMGRLIVATNVNDILVRTLATGRYEIRSVEPTASPAMDIQVSSNFERLVFEACGRDGSMVAGLMSDLAKGGGFELPPPALGAIKAEFDAVRIDEETCRRTIGSVYESTGRLIDPHTAIGVAAATSKRDRRLPMVALATAHPAKFPEAVAAAAGRRPEAPPSLRELASRGERYVTLPNDLDTVRDHIASRVRAAP